MCQKLGQRSRWLCNTRSAKTRSGTHPSFGRHGRILQLMTMQLRQAINNYKPIERKVLASRQVQGGSRGAVTPVTDYKPVRFMKVDSTNTRTLPRPAQGQN